MPFKMILIRLVHPSLFLSDNLGNAGRWNYQKIVLRSALIFDGKKFFNHAGSKTGLLVHFTNSSMRWRLTLFDRTAGKTIILITVFDTAHEQYLFTADNDRASAWFHRNVAYTIPRAESSA